MVTPAQSAMDVSRQFLTLAEEFDGLVAVKIPPGAVPREAQKFEDWPLLVGGAEHVYALMAQRDPYNSVMTNAGRLLIMACNQGVVGQRRLKTFVTAFLKGKLLR